MDAIGNGSLPQYSAFCVVWLYNHEHYHSSLGLLTPATVHYGQSADLLEKRQRVLDAAYAAHPERFVKKHPTVQSLPDAVWINRPQPLLEVGAEPPLGV